MVLRIRQPLLASIAAGAAPFTQTNWPPSKGVRFNTTSGSSPTNINLFNNPIPFNQLDWDKRVFLQPRAPDGSRQTNINLFTNPLPFHQMDWQTGRMVPDLPPPAQPYNLALYNVVVIPAPFYKTDWSITKFPTPQVFNTTQQTNINLFTNPIPFHQMDWQTGRMVPDLPAPAQPYNLALYNVVVAASPFYQTNWPAPFARAFLAPSNQALNINLIPAAPADVLMAQIWM